MYAQKKNVVVVPAGEKTVQSADMWLRMRASHNRLESFGCQCGVAWGIVRDRKNEQHTWTPVVASGVVAPAQGIKKLSAWVWHNMGYDSGSFIFSCKGSSSSFLRAQYWYMFNLSIRNIFDWICYGVEWYFIDIKYCNWRGCLALWCMAPLDVPMCPIRVPGSSSKALLLSWISANVYSERLQAMS